MSNKLDINKLLQKPSSSTPIDYSGIEIPDITKVHQVVQNFEDWRKSQGFKTNEEKLQEAQERASAAIAELGNSEDVYDWYNAHQPDPRKQAKFREDGAKTAGLLMTVPLTVASAGTMGWVPALTSTATGFAGAYGGKKLGEVIDTEYGTNTTPWLTLAGGFAGGIGGYKGLVKAGSAGLLKGSGQMYGKQFMGDVAADVLTKQTKLVPKQQKFNMLMDLSRSDEFVQQNLFQDPTDVKTIIHGDGAASGFNDPKKLTTVGHRELTSLKQLPHFERDRIVPANTEITQPGGRVISAKEHPLFLSDTQPWYETAHNGETLKRYWGIDGENSTGLWEWIDKKGKMHIPTESPYRFITTNIDDLPDTKLGQFTGRRGSSEYELLEGIPLSKIKSAFEYDPVLKTWKRVQYVDPPKPTSKGSYAWLERPSKLTEAERLGIPRGERNQPAKAPNPKYAKKLQSDDTSSPVYEEDVLAFHKAFTKQPSESIQIQRQLLLDWYNSPQYRERLINQGFNEEQINKHLSQINERLSSNKIKYVEDLNSVRDWGFTIPGWKLKVFPNRSIYEAMTNDNIQGLPGMTVVQLPKQSNIPDVFPHEVGGHGIESFVSDFKHLYGGQKLTDLGRKATVSTGLPEGYYPSWEEVRARAMTIAKQMREAGWNPNSPEQVNVWLNKNILTNTPSNANQGALYYSRPEFIKAVTTGLKHGGKINPQQ